MEPANSMSAFQKEHLESITNQPLSQWLHLMSHSTYATSKRLFPITLKPAKHFLARDIQGDMVMNFLVGIQRV